MKEEVKNLIKRRNGLVEIYKKICEDSNNPINSESTVNLYEDSRCHLVRTITGMDLRLREYVEESPVGNWLLQIKGMESYIAAGLLAYFNIKGKDCAAQFIKFAGADNYSNPHNSEVSKLLDNLIYNFKLFDDSAYYLINEDKFIELTNSGIDDTTARIKADRYMRKVFISHLFEEMYREEHDGQAPERHNRDCIIVEPEVPYTK
jgi:hypothetical protein